MTSNVKVIKSGVWTDQAQQNWCNKPNHARPETYRWKSVQEKTTTKTIKRRVLVETENESVVCFLWILSGRVWRQKPTGRTWAHRTETEIRTKAHRLISLSFIPVMSPFVLTTPGHPSHHFFTRFHRSLPLGRIPHHTRQQCLPLCVMFSTTRDGRVCLWVIFIVIIQYDSVCLSVST